MSEESPSEESPRPTFAERGVVVAGLRIASAMNDAPRAFLARAPLVVLPAVGHPWRNYTPILEHFGASRRVFALDWPGFGGSDKPAPDAFAYDAAHYAEVLAGWMDALGIGRAVLLGNAVGGAVAVRYALAQPQRVLGLALVAPAGFAPAGLTRALAARILGAPGLLRRVEPSFVSLALGPGTAATRAIVAEQRARRASPDHATIIAASAALWRQSDTPASDLSDLAKGVGAPAIVVRGALDPIFTAADSRRAAAALGVRGALEVVLPGAGHLPFLQQPTRFAQAVDGLLAAAEIAALSGA